MSLTGRTAVVTGASQGIGAAVAEGLARAGCAVLLTARNLANLTAVADSIRAAGGVAHPVACDVTDPDSVQALAHEAQARLGRADILVNNAGTAVSAALEKTTLPEWQRLFAVNVTGTFLCTQALIGPMAGRGWGRVVNIASVAGLAGAKYISAYAASKHAVIGFTRSVAAEYAARGVTVNAVCPGYVDTPLTTQSVERIMTRTGRSRSEALQAILATSAQARLIEPAEVAHAVLALCADEAKGINGQSLVIDGGGLLA